MKAYNLHEIMSNAWAMYRKWAAPTSTITAVSPAATLLQCVSSRLGPLQRPPPKGRRRHRPYALQPVQGRVQKKCQTVEGSYDKATKTIEVMTKAIRTFERPAYTAARTARRPSVTAIRGLLPPLPHLLLR